MVERISHKDEVAGSSPASSTIIEIRYQIYCHKEFDWIILVLSETNHFLIEWEPSQMLEAEAYNNEIVDFMVWDLIGEIDL